VEVERLNQNWRSLNGGANLMALVLAGCTFKDSILERQQMLEIGGRKANDRYAEKYLHNI